MNRYALSQIRSGAIPFLKPSLTSPHPVSRIHYSTLSRPNLVSQEVNTIGSHDSTSNVTTSSSSSSSSHPTKSFAPSSSSISTPSTTPSSSQAPNQSSSVVSSDEESYNENVYFDNSGYIPQEFAYPPGMVFFQPFYVPVNPEFSPIPVYSPYAYPINYNNSSGFHPSFSNKRRAANNTHQNGLYFPSTSAPSINAFINSPEFSNNYFYPPTFGGSSPYVNGTPPPSFPSGYRNNAVNDVSFASENEFSEDFMSEGRDYPSQLYFDDLFQLIQNHFREFATCRVSWLNRLFCKASSVEEWNSCLEILNLYQQNKISLTQETGTLLIKSACRLNVPEQALELIRNPHYNLWPTLSGVHYLMINFSQKRDSARVLEAFQIIKLRNLTPNSKTYHILIRECADNGSFEHAVKLAEECKDQNIIPNRVTYNILMNGFRKTKNADKILALRSEMDQHEMELNDTTAKFTALAYLMKGESEKSVESFLEAPSIQKDNQLEAFCNKLIETGKEDLYFKNLVLDLLEKVQKKIRFPPSLLKQVEQLKSLTF